MSLPITILGVSARGAAAAARRAGFEPYSVDLFADLDTQQAGRAVRIERFPQDFLPALQAAPDSAWLYTGGLENYSELVEELASIRPLVGNGSNVLRAVRDPERLASALIAAGLNYPKAPTNAHDQPRIFKPLRSGGGRGVHLVPAGDARRVPSGWHEQRYLEGEPASVLYIAKGDTCLLLGASRQLVGQRFGAPEPFGYVGSIALLDRTSVLEAELIRIGATLTEAFSLQGVFGVDVILQGDQAWVLEVNPRITASAEVIERATGRNPVALHIAACSDVNVVASEIASLPHLRQLHGKAVVYATTACRAGSTLSRLIADWNESYLPLIADIPDSGSQFAAGEPVLTVFAEGETEEVVLAKLQQRTAQVLATLEQL